MNTKRLSITIACAALLASGLAVGGEIYKWVDENGNVHYGDRPSGEANVEHVAEIRSRNTDRAAIAARVDERRKARAAAEQVESEAPEEMSREELRAEQEARHEKCESYRAQLQSFLASTRLYREDQTGERSYLDEEQTMAARSRVEDKIKEYCGAS